MYDCSAVVYDELLDGMRSRLRSATLILRAARIIVFVCLAFNLARWSLGWHWNDAIDWPLLFLQIAVLFAAIGCLRQILAHRKLLETIRQHIGDSPAVASRLSNDDPPNTILAPLVTFLLPAGQRTAAFGDLAEEFRRIEAQHGRAAAGIWYCRQLRQSVGPLLWQAATRLIVGAVLSVREINRRRID